MKDENIKVLNIKVQKSKFKTFKDYNNKACNIKLCTPLKSMGKVYRSSTL